MANYPIIVIVFLVVLFLIIYVVRKNRKDRKKFEHDIIRSELKPQKHEEDEVEDNRD